MVHTSGHKGFVLDDNVCYSQRLSRKHTPHIDHSMANYRRAGSDRGNAGDPVSHTYSQEVSCMDLHVCDFDERDGRLQ